MEATKEGAGLLDKILPPRLEDAGLEDCALPSDSIQEAFLKAAGAVKSRAAAFFDDPDEDADGGCVADPWPADKEKDTDVVVGVSPPSTGALDTVVVGASGDTRPCVAGDGEDKVIIGGGEEANGGRGCGGVCGGGLEGLDTEGEKSSDAEEEEEHEERPTLVEGVV